MQPRVIDRWLALNFVLGVAFADEIQDGQAEKNEHGAEQRALQVSGVAPDEHGASAEDEDRGQEGVSPDAIGPREIGLTPPIEEDGGCSEHVEEPLREDRELEVLLKLGEEEQQNGGKQRLDYE